MPTPHVFVLSLLLGVAGAAAAQPCPAPPPGAPPLVAPDLRGLRVGLALGSGSMHGLAHVGVILELEAARLPVPIVAGTSVGAVIGSLWASGVPARRIEELSRDAGWEDVGRLSPSPRGLYSNVGLRDQMRRLQGTKPIEAWPRRFAAVATEMSRGDRRVLSKGDGAEAVQASSAVPVMFAPVRIDGEALADGALVEPLPARAARELGADFVLAVDVAYRPYEEESSGLLGTAFQSMHVLINALARAQRREADYTLQLDLHHVYVRCGAAGVVGAGRLALREAWPQIVASAQRRAKAGH